ncbi:hypothetical protein C0213_02040 [Latilactobacillus sakei]|nr:phenylalanine--tRNA ligase beta subunit-related protein [Latilactobacillus sakei]AUX11267.1 hypothetical protein C0213_02040 [Latilactobacillus sakei]
MKKMIIDDSFWQLFPKAQINILRADGLDNTVDKQQDAYFQARLQAGSERAHDFLGAEPFSQNAVVAQWREGFTKFKTKKGARSSIEALLKRIDQGHTFEPINPLVDLYNSVSLKYAVPCGGEDIAQIDGDLHLGVAQGGESFRPLGAQEDAPALPNEVIYYDQTGAICRCLNWREAQRTMLQEQTQSAVLVMESINDEQAKRANQAMAELQQEIEAYFKVKTTTAVLTLETPSVTL